MLIIYYQNMSKFHYNLNYNNFLIHFLTGESPQFTQTKITLLLRKSCSNSTFWFWRCLFHQHFTSSFFVQKCLGQLLCDYNLSLELFGKSKLVQKLHVKCWWNWLKVDKPFILTRSVNPIKLADDGYLPDGKLVHIWFN